MSILKGILHHWNKTTQSYDTIHPETEVSQVTDWNQGIVNTLASTALGTLVNTLTSDSLLATMIQKVLTATGVKYSMGQNGYICFGSLFGRLIIQWGYVQNANGNTNTYVTLPISATQNIGVLNVSDTGTSDSVWNGNLINSNTILITAYRPNGIALKGIEAKWLLVCF